jgi:hypothetical protein
MTFSVRLSLAMLSQGMNPIFYGRQTDPQSVCATLVAVRCMASLTGESNISLRIARAGERFPRCRGVSDMLIEPVGVCTVCWSILALNGAIEWLKEPLGSKTLSVPLLDGGRRTIR